VGRPAASAEQVKEYVEQGFRLFQAPTDIGLMMAGAKSYLKAGYGAELPPAIY
jgi:hypothetical protein